MSSCSIEGVIEAKGRPIEGERARRYRALKPSARDAEDGVLGGVGQLLELGLDLPAPAGEVGVDDRRLLGVRDLGRCEGLSTAPRPELATPGRAEVPGPLRVSTRRDEISVPVELEEVHDRRAHFPTVAASDPELSMR